MAERILRSPGVTTQELDLSAPGSVKPQGIPAAVIGTAQKGPAFVPINFATKSEFANLFGVAEGKHFGMLAVNEWMTNARSGIFLRVLGAGDCKKKDTNNMTTNAGFVVGQMQINYSGTGYDADGSSNAQKATDLETAGSAHKPKTNPYAGNGSIGFMTLGAVTGEQTVAGRAEISKVLILDNDPNTVSNYDGMFIIYHSTNADTASPTVGKNIVFLSAQAEGTAANGARSVSGNKILDGYSTLYDFSSEAPDSLRIADISGATTNRGAIATAIAAVITSNPNNAVGSTIAEDTGHIATPATLVITNDHFGNVPNISVGSTNTTKAVADYLSITTGPTNSTQDGGVSVAGIDTVDGVAFSQTITFGDSMVIDDTLLTLKAQGSGNTRIFGWSSDGSASGAADSINTTTDNTVKKAIGALLKLLVTGIDADQENGIKDIAASTVNQANLNGGSHNNMQIAYAHATQVLTITQAAAHTDALPLTAVAVEQNANAGVGSTHFLSCAMKTADNEVDYLGVANAAEKQILRGVLMFPSGVLPGLEDASGGITSAQMPAATYGTYATGKDEGSDVGDITDGVFKMVLNGYSNSDYDAFLTGSFDPTSPIYFPRVFNTDPSKIQERGHYLHAHYDVPAGLALTVSAADNVQLHPGYWNANAAGAAADSDVVAGNIDKVDSFSSVANHHYPNYDNWRAKFSHAFTPWIISQKLGSSIQKLFRFHLLDAGVPAGNSYKVSIANIAKSQDAASDYGKFDVLIRDGGDSDTKPIVLQSFSGVNLNPSSDRYIARVIGDQNTYFDFEKNEGNQKLRTEGLYPNRSQYVRIEMNAAIENGTMEATALPMGFAGKHHLVLDGASLYKQDGGGTLEIFEPPLPLRQNVSVGSGTTKVVDSRYYWGAQYQDIRSVSTRNKQTGMISLVHNLTKWFPEIGGQAAWVGDNANTQDPSSGGQALDADLYNNNLFTLERLFVRCLSQDTTKAVDPTWWHEAIYVRDASAVPKIMGAGDFFYDGIDDSAVTSRKIADNGYRYLDVSKDFSSTASKRYYKFTVPFQGGFDGLDIFDQEKAKMSDMSSFREMSSNSSSVLGGPNGPTTAAFRKGLDILAEKSDVDCQILATPGMRDTGITDYAIDKTEERFDALYIMDIPAIDHESYLVTTSAQETSVSNTAQQLFDRNLDTSFAACYFPDLVVKDGSISVVAPPSVSVLGALSLNDLVAHPWYAPAGFARGALANTIETAVKLNRTNMDVLYESDINPITSFPQTGDSVIVFGQKTMLQAQSALDRVNVRRLLIDIRRKVRSVANTILFEPNRESTLAKFSALVNPILGRIQAQQGLDRYKVVIDTTTTTQEDVENNTIRGKIFLQPTRSIEFISLDFVVTNAGAEI